MEQQPKQEQLQIPQPNPKPDGWYKLLDYCMAHADNIYVRCCMVPGGTYYTIKLSHLRFNEVIDQIDRWYKEGKRTDG